MGILDKVTSVLPWHSRSSRRLPATPERVALHDDIDRWLQRLLEEPFRGGADRLTAPPPTIRETDDELVITVDVPGLDRDDLDLTLTPGGLTIRGERGAESDGEYVYRNFVASVPLPPGLDAERAEARVERGVLTIRFPKVGAATGMRRIRVGS
jgi:HSP20 family protein